MGHTIDGRANERPIDGESAAVVAETMYALATPSRVRILGRLCESPCSVGELAAAVEMEQSAVSHQLRVLRLLGLVVGVRRGRKVIYAPYDDHIGAFLREAVSHAQHVRLGLVTPVAEHRLADAS